MRTIRREIITVVTVVMTLLGGALRATAQRTPPSNINYRSWQLDPYPPLPFNPFPDLPSYTIDSNTVVYDDRTVDYPALWGMGASRVSADDSPSFPGFGNGSGGDGGSGSAPGFVSFDTNGLWIEITGITNSLVSLRLHNTIPGDAYQLLSKTNITNGLWSLGEITSGATGTNVTDFDPVSMWDFPTHLVAPNFFRAQHADGTNCDGIVSVVDNNNAVQPNTNNADPGSDGFFTFTRSQSVNTPELAFYYTITGTASNGVDYAAIPAVTNFAAGQTVLGLRIVTFERSHGGLEQYVTVTLVRTNTYLTDPINNTADVIISENLTNSLLQSIADPTLVQMVGLDYDIVSNKLVMSVNFDTGFPFNFAIVGTNTTVTNGSTTTNVTVSEWSSVTGMPDEIQLASVQQTNGGWTLGDLYFDNGIAGQIGWLSADGTISNLTWATLTNEPFKLRSVYLDHTGVFGYDLLAAAGTAGTAGFGTNGGDVYRIKPNADPTQADTNISLLINLTNTTLEGIGVMPNDTNKYGPWAGKVLVGAEEAIPPAVFAIDTNGVASRWFLGIQPEDFYVIPTNQDFYVADNITEPAFLWKLPRKALTNHVGDILIIQGGEEGGFQFPALFIVRWDAPSQSFLKWSVTNPRTDEFHDFEQGSFAPVSLPAESQSTHLPIPTP